MTHTYGAQRPEFDKPYDFFGVTVEVLEKRDFESPGRKTWPYFPVIFKRSDTSEVIGEVAIPTPANMILDESNVFDILEFLIRVFGKREEGSASPYDITLTFDQAVSGNPVFRDTRVTMKRGVGCRHFIFKSFQRQAVHVTSHGRGVSTELPRHEIPSILFVKSNFSNVGSWTAGIDTEGLKITFWNKGESVTPAKVYHIPFTFTPTPKEISRLQITGTKHYVNNPELFTGNSGTYYPTKLVKHVVDDQFWYLKSFDGEVLVTLIKDAWMQAMRAVFNELKLFSADDRRQLELTYSEWLARCSTNYDGKEREKAIVSDSIQMLERISKRREELADSN